MANIAFRRFRTGEVSPELYAATDTQAYLQGLRTLLNGYVMRMGGVQNRPGTLYKGTTKSNGAARLVDAVFDVTENYVLEFGNLYVRIWRDGALLDVGTLSAWVTATAYVVGDLRSNGGTNYVCLEAHTSGTFATDLAAGKWYALTGTTYEFPTPYTTAQLAALQFQRNYRVVTIVHPSHPPATLTFDANGYAVLADINFSDAVTPPSNLAVSGTSGTGWGYTVTAIVDGVESTAPATVRTNIVAGYDIFATVFAVLASAPRTVTWDAVTGASGYRVYANTSDALSTYYTTDVATNSFVDNGSSFVFSAATASPPVASGSFGGAGDYPGVVGAYQQRLLLAGSTNEPDVVNASQTASPYNFTVSDPIVDTDALSWRQVGQRLNRPRFFAEVANRLVQMTDIGETFIQGSEDNILRPGEINPRQISYNGIAKDVPPLLVDDTILYVQARGGQVRDLVPFNQDGYTGTEVSRTAQHLVDGETITAMAYQKVPHSICWMVRGDGSVLSLTYVREEGIFGWARHDFGGDVESVTTVPEGDEDAVYAVVKRTVAGDAPLSVVGDGDLTITGSGYDATDTVTLTGTVSPPVASDEWYITNQDLTDANNWTPSNISVVSAGTAGSRQWFALTEDTTNNYHDVLGASGFFTSQVNDEYVVDFRVVANGRDAIYVSVNTDSGNRLVGIDLTDGSVFVNTDLGLAGFAVTTTDEGNNVWRVQMTAPVAAPAGTNTFLYVDVYLAQSTTGVALNDTFYVGDGLSGVYLSWVTPLGPFSQDAIGRVLTTTGGGQVYVTDVTDSTTASGRVVTAIPSGEQAQPVADWTWKFAFESTARYVERLTDRLADFPVLVDASITTSSPNETIVGLDHLNGHAVSVIVDGVVIASPNNPSLPVIVVEDGGCTLPTGVFGDEIIIGLPYVTDIQTLDIDAVGTTIKNSGQFSGGIIAWVRDTGAFWAGPTEPASATAVTDLERIVPVDENWDAVTTLESGTVSGVLLSTVNDNGRIFLRQVDPVPMTILALAPQGTFGRNR